MSEVLTANSFGIKEALVELGIKELNSGVATGDFLPANGEVIESYSPATGELIGKVTCGDANDYEKVISKAKEAFSSWRMVPAPVRVEMVRQFGEALIEKKEALGKLVSFEMGKSYQEGLGEVQEMIDTVSYTHLTLPTKA